MDERKRESFDPSAAQFTGGRGGIALEVEQLKNLIPPLSFY